MQAFNFLDKKTKHSAEVNAADNSGKTALMMAAENGQAGAVGMYTWHVDFTFGSI